MDIQKNIATVLRAVKESRGKSLSEFSAELEISRSALQEYLSGVGNPNATTMEHLANKLGIDTAFLVSGAFSYDQIQVLMRLLETLHLLTDIPLAYRRRFAELLLEMVSLWEEHDNG